MSKQREALELALEALQWNWGGEPLPTLEIEAIEALKRALAEPKQEPICDKDPQGCWNVRCQLGKVCKNTTPPARKPLTDREIEKCMKEAYATVQGRQLEHAFARAIERAHGITND